MISFEDAFEQAPAGLALLGAEGGSAGRFTHANRAFRELVGRGEDELVGSGLLDVLPEGEAAERGRLERLLEGEGPGYAVEKRIGRSGAPEVWIEVDVRAMPGEGGRRPAALIAQAQDVTAHRWLAEAAGARDALTHVITGSATVEGSISAALPALAEALEFEFAAAWVVDPDIGALRYAGLWRSPELHAPLFTHMTRELRLERGSGLPGRAWESGCTVYVDDFGAAHELTRSSAARQEGIRTGVAFPVALGPDVLGVIELAGTRSRPVEAGLLALVGDLGEHISALLARKRPEEWRPASSDLLLIEDHAFVAELVREMLSVTTMPLNLVHEETLAGGRERLLVERPACVLLDLTLPDADGLEALTEVRKLRPEVPVVVLTGHEDDELSLRAVQEGAQDFLSKRRADFHALARSIRYAIERKGAEQHALEQRLRDPLTGLPNRVLLLDRLRVAVSRDLSGSVALLVVNLDRFRQANDSLGHDSGDRLLVEAAGRIVATAGTGSTVASLGGDEFAVLLESVEDERPAVDLAHRLEDSLRAPYAFGDERASVTATIGIALEAGGRGDAGRLLEHAAVAVSRGKELGGDRSEVYEEAVQDRVRARLHVENGLRAALERGELRTFYQPIVALDDMRPLGFEALVRWQHPERGLLAPGEFMQVAEDSGLVVPLGAWVMREASGQLAAWTAASGQAAGLTVNVNLSARQLADPELVPALAAAAAAGGLAPARVCLEVTETAVMEDEEQGIERLHALKREGFGLALDDFGTGYSSLSHLERLPVDVLKLDRSFVATIGDGPAAPPIVAAVANMASALGLTPLAEGVETARQRDCVRELGYTLAQGYLFSKPVPAQEAIGLIERVQEGNEVRG